MSGTGNLSLLSAQPGTERTVETTRTTGGAKASRTSKAGLTVGIIALILGIVAIIMIIVFIIVWAVNRNNDVNNPHWKIIIGKADGNNSNAELFKPDGNDIFVVGARAAHVTVTIQKPGNNLTGRVFMIDNTGNSSGCTVQSTEVVIVDHINGSFSGSVIEGRSTATYIWTSAGAIRRLY